MEEHQEAVRQYEPFIDTTPIIPAQIPEPIDYEALKAAHDRLEKAQAWLDRIRQEFYEAVRNQAD